MSTRGPKPKPTSLKELQGNPGHRPLNKNQPKPKTPVKKHRGMEPVQKRFWDDHAPELERLQVLTGIDTAAFRLMAEHYALAIKSSKRLHDEGLTVRGKDGEKKNPLAQIFKDNAMAFKAFAVEFGMTPSSRTRLKLPEEAEQLSLAAQLFQAVGEVVVTGDDES